MNNREWIILANAALTATVSLLRRKGLELDQPELTAMAEYLDNLKEQVPKQD